MGKFLNRSRSEIANWLVWLVFAIPGLCGVYVRSWCLSRFVKRCGFQPVIAAGCELSGGNIVFGSRLNFLRHVVVDSGELGSVEIGDDVSINRNVIIDAGPAGEVVIGSGSLIGPNCVLRACNHCFDSTGIPIRKQGILVDVSSSGPMCGSEQTL